MKKLTEEELNALKQAISTHCEMGKENLKTDGPLLDSAYQKIIENNASAEEDNVGGFTLEDVRCQAKGKNLTEDQLAKVFYQMGKRFDASQGMCWDTIDFHIDEVLRRNK